jgi:hypothetical protein
VAAAFAYLAETFAAPLPVDVLASLQAMLTPAGRVRLGIARTRAFIHAVHSP